MCPGRTQQRGSTGLTASVLSSTDLGSHEGSFTGTQARSVLAPPTRPPGDAQVASSPRPTSTPSTGPCAPAAFIDGRRRLLTATPTGCQQLIPAWISPPL